MRFLNKFLVYLLNILIKFKFVNFNKAIIVISSIFAIMIFL